MIEKKCIYIFKRGLSFPFLSDQPLFQLSFQLPFKPFSPLFAFVALFPVFSYNVVLVERQPFLIERERDGANKVIERERKKHVSFPLLSRLLKVFFFLGTYLLQPLWKNPFYARTIALSDQR